MRAPRPNPWRTIAAGGLSALLAAGLASTPSTPAYAVPAPPSGWTLVWGDDFTGPAGGRINGDHWMYATGTSYPGGAPNWGTGEVETMTDSTDNVSLDGQGHVAITPRRDAQGRWTSARIETRRTDFQPPPGGRLRVEASIKQPDVSGAEAAGYWPAFWALGGPARPVGATNWPGVGEFDILENVNGRDSHFAALHCGTGIPGTCNETTGLPSGERPCPGCKTSFHTYGVEWDRSGNGQPQALRWYRDGNNYWTLTRDQVDRASWDNALNHGYFVILNVAIGGGFPAAFGGGPTPETRPGAAMLVDYVAIYSTGTASTPPPTTPPPSTPPPSPTSPPPTSPPPGGGGTSAYATTQAEAYADAGGVRREATTDTGGGESLAYLANGDWASYRDLDFGTGGSQFVARVASGVGGGASGLVEVRLDSRTAAPVGSFAVANTGGWQSWRTVPANMARVTGRHTVYLTFTSGQPADFVNVNWFTFGR